MSGIIYVFIVTLAFTVFLPKIKSSKEEKEIPNYFHNITKQSNLLCSPITCSINQGICINNTCECFYGYLTLLQIDQSTHYCNYKQHCRVTSFFLEFFFPFGAGHLYAGKYNLAMIKFLSFILFFCFICGEFFYLTCKLSAMNKFHVYLALIIIADIFFWLIMQIVDLFCYAMGLYTDGKGFDLI